MMPVYRCMESFPQDNNQMPFTQYYRPGFPAVPPHIKSDPATPHFAYESWPYGGSYDYSMPWQPCCHHNGFPGYYSLRPSYPHFPPPSPMYCLGGHPAYHEAYPVPYVLPPHCSMELPRYEYDKNMPRSYQCCGCPNHAPDQKENKSVKIEEQESDVEKKGNHSLAPVRVKNYPYPIVWIPPEHANDKGHKEPCQSKAVEPDNVSLVAKPPGSSGFDEEPRVWHGWFPLDRSNLGSLMQGADEKSTQNQQNENKRRQFPFPIIWMPYSDKEESGKDEKEMDAMPATAKEQLGTSIFIPENAAGSGDHTNTANVNEKTVESNDDSRAMKDKTSKQKNIPVKQIDSHMEDRSEDTPSRGRSVNTMTKPSGTSSKRHSSSPPKTSKLSPVCLRVDPFPSKKHGNGSLRSPSSPAAKEHLKEVEPKEKEKVMEVVERKTSIDKDRDLKDESKSQDLVDLQMASQGEVSEKPTEKRTGKDGKESEVQNDKETRKAGDRVREESMEERKVTDSAKLAGEEGKLEKKSLLAEEAAVLIQSAYRGYQVRKWETLKKLKQIAEVSQQMVVVRKQIQIIESDTQRDEKERVAIGETIMRLLLKLDTIQGLHPTVREIRKSLARELVALQEQLDSLVIRPSGEAIEMVSTAENKEQHPVEADNSFCMQEQSTEEAAGLEDSSGKTCNQSHELREPCGQEEHEKSEGGNSEAPVSSDVMILMNKKGEPQQSLEQKEVVLNSEVDVSQVQVKNVEHESTEFSELEQSNEFPSVEEKMESYSDIEDRVRNLPVIQKVEDSLQGATDEELTVFDSEEGEQVGMENNILQQGEVETNMSANVTASVEVDVLMTTDEAQEVTQLEGLESGVMDEGPAVSEFEKPERVQIDGNEKYHVEVTMSSPNGGAQIASQLGQQLQEVPEEPFNSESPEWTKAGKQKDENLSKEATSEMTVEPPSAPSVASESADPQTAISEADTDGLGGVRGDIIQVLNSVDCTCSPVVAGTGVPTPETEAPNGENKEDDDVQPLAITEEKEGAVEAGNEIQDEVVIDHADGPETVEQDPLHVEDVEEGGAPLVASPTDSKISGDEADSGIGSEKKLIEENEKLRKMIELLVKTGNEQSTVISSLTGRVKDLEKSLSRKKKLRTRHYGSPISRSSYGAKPSNKLRKERACDVARSLSLL